MFCNSRPASRISRHLHLGCKGVQANSRVKINGHNFNGTQRIHLPVWASYQPHRQPDFGIGTRHTGSDKFGYTCQCLIIHVLNALRWTFTRKVMMRNRWETHRNEVKPWEIRGWNREKRGGTVRTALHVYQPHYFGYLSYLAVLFYAVYHQKNHEVSVMVPMCGSSPKIAWFRSSRPGEPS
jgi:hypothetical protein